MSKTGNQEQMNAAAEAYRQWADSGTLTHEYIRMILGEPMQSFSPNAASPEPTSWNADSHK